MAVAFAQRGAERAIRGEVPVWVRSLELFLELFFGDEPETGNTYTICGEPFSVTSIVFFVRGPNTARRTRPRHSTTRALDSHPEMFKREEPETERLLASNPRQKLTVHRGQLYFNDPRVAGAAAPASSSGQSHSARIAEKYGGRRYFGGGFSDNTLVDLNQSSSEGDVTSGTEYSDYDYVTDERAQQMERGMRGASVPAGIQTRTAVSNRRGRSGSSSYSNMINASTAMIALVVCAVLVALGLFATGAVSTDVVSSMFSVERESLAPQADVSESDDHAHGHRASTRSARDEKEEEEDKVYPVEIGADADAIGPRAAARAAEEAARKRAAASAKLGDDAKKGARRASSKGASSKRASSRKGVSGEDASSFATRSTSKGPESAGTAKAADAGAKLGDFQKAEEAAARMRNMGFASPEVPNREEPAAETEEASDESRR